MQWKLIEPHVPPPPTRRRDGDRKPVPSRPALTGILYVLRTGIPWANPPRETSCGASTSWWLLLLDCHAAEM